MHSTSSIQRIIPDENESEKIIRILILYDYRGYLATSCLGTLKNHVYGMVDIDQIVATFVSLNCIVEKHEFAELDLSSSYKGWYVFYASSEECGLFYKGYIEDILLYLELGGAILIPSFTYFRAHHDKCFAEILRHSFSNEKLKSPYSFIFGNYSELSNYTDVFDYPCVLKVSAGAGSLGVCLVHSRAELMKTAKKLMTQTYYDYTHRRIVYNNIIRIAIQTAKKIIPLPYNPLPLRSNKIIIQKYIPHLSGDNKVLYFYGKYYVLCRKNRPNDFRASGSGIFAYPNSVDEVKDILNLAKIAVDEIKMPIISMDIGQNDEGCYLLEYQCVSFGPLTMQASSEYYQYNTENGNWNTIHESSVLEVEFARSIVEYINWMRNLQPVNIGK